MFHTYKICTAKNKHKKQQHRALIKSTFPKRRHWNFIHPNCEYSMCILENSWSRVDEFAGRDFVDFVIVEPNLHVFRWFLRNFYNLALNVKFQIKSATTLTSPNDLKFGMPATNVISHHQKKVQFQTPTLGRQTLTKFS